MTDTSNHCVTHHVDKFYAEQLMVGKVHLIGAVVGDLLQIGIRDQPKTANLQTLIYDGKEWIELNHSIDSRGTLPAQFHVIDNGIPANYWSHDPKNGHEGINSKMVNFDYVPVRDQCIANLVVDENDTTLEESDIGKSHTKFYYKDDPKPYYIYFRNNTREQMEQVLNRDMIELEHMNHPRKMVISEFLNFFTEGGEDHYKDNYENDNYDDYGDVFLKYFPKAEDTKDEE